MKRFIAEADRAQITLLPESLDDYIDEANPVRAIDAFVALLDLAELGLEVVPEATGRPGYHPSVLLRLFIYGYLLVEINGSIHSAVKKYVTDKNAQKNPRKK